MGTSPALIYKTRTLAPRSPYRRLDIDMAALRPAVLKVLRACFAPKTTWRRPPKVPRRATFCATVATPRLITSR